MSSRAQRVDSVQEHTSGSGGAPLKLWVYCTHTALNCRPQSPARRTVVPIQQQAAPTTTCSPSWPHLCVECGAQVAAVGRRAVGELGSHVGQLRNGAHLIGLAHVVVSVARVGRNAVLRQARTSESEARCGVAGASQGPPAPSGRRRPTAANRADLRPLASAVSPVPAQGQRGCRSGGVAWSAAPRPQTPGERRPATRLEVQCCFDSLHCPRSGARKRQGWEQVSAVAGGKQTGVLCATQRCDGSVGSVDCGGGRCVGPSLRRRHGAECSMPRGMSRAVARHVCCCLSETMPDAFSRCQCCTQVRAQLLHADKDKVQNGCEAEAMNMRTTQGVAKS